VIGVGARLSSALKDTQGRRFRRQMGFGLSAVHAAATDLTFASIPLQSGELATVGAGF